MSPVTTKRAPRILMILTWFGPWPAWMRFFVTSCAWNPTVDWAIWSDQPAPADLPGNVRVFTQDFVAYRDLVAARLEIAPRWNDAYKLCDLKPALGLIHRDLLDGYDYWGFGDLDVIYGDIRAIYTPQVLNHDLVSSHDDIVAGHFSLLRATPKMVEAFKRVPGWARLLADDDHKSFDEQVFSRLFLTLRGRHKLRRLVTPFLGGGLFVERYSTLFSQRKWIDGTENYPARWFWREGRLTPDGDDSREFLYLHFSMWQSDRWTPGRRAPWKLLDRLDNCPPGPLKGFSIGPEGFHPLPGA